MKPIFYMVIVLLMTSLSHAQPILTHSITDGSFTYTYSLMEEDVEHVFSLYKLVKQEETMIDLSVKLLVS